MPRIRSIKPDFPQSESMGRVSRESRLLFILLWTLCDDEGRLRASSRVLASLLYPYDDDAHRHMEKWLAELEREKCVIRYSVDDCTYLQICNWLKHQKIDHPSPSKIPPFREDSRVLAKIIEPLDNPRSGLDRIGEDRKGSGKDRSVGSVAEIEQTILSQTNEILGKKFQGSKIALAHIRRRLSEGRTVEDFRRVCENMLHAWGKDPKMSQYLCPETLFGEKFDKYLNLTIAIPTTKADEWNAIAAREMAEFMKGATSDPNNQYPSSNGAVRGGDAAPVQIAYAAT